MSDIFCRASDRACLESFTLENCQLKCCKNTWNVFHGEIKIHNMALNACEHSGCGLDVARAEQVSESSHDRKQEMNSTTIGNKPDFRVKLFFSADSDEGDSEESESDEGDSEESESDEGDSEESESDEEELDEEESVSVDESVEELGEESDDGEDIDEVFEESEDEEDGEGEADGGVELLFGECSRVNAKWPKHNRDWKKLLRTCKDGHNRLYKEILKGKNKPSSAAKKITKSLLVVPMTGVLVVNNHIIVFLDSFYKAYEIFDLTVPLEVSQRSKVKNLLKNAIRLKMYFEGVADEVVSLKSKSNDLPPPKYRLRPDVQHWKPTL
ncbi:2540_t:CDS:2 [Paraglomus brasilianum]|uniref:2540_t:CDS:1 n=1 Tax=Paraglomus brasilianum TaxID=144538 RepID=A0A9N9CZ00_9GLOM|nr:2540_t:CDS:2 [Paraglomus brasilianum]